MFGIGLYKNQTSSENESTAETGSSADTKVEKVESGEIRQNDLNQVSASQNDEEDCQDEEENNEEQVTDMQSANAVNTRENNPFFFNVDRVEYHGRFHPLSYNFVYQDTNIFINVIEEMEDGTLYTLEIEQLQVEDPYDEITMGMNNMGYFFVTEDTFFNSKFPNAFGALLMCICTIERTLFDLNVLYENSHNTARSLYKLSPRTIKSIATGNSLSYKENMLHGSFVESNRPVR